MPFGTNSDPTSPSFGPGMNGFGFGTGFPGSGFFNTALKKQMSLLPASSEVGSIASGQGADQIEAATGGPQSTLSGLMASTGARGNAMLGNSVNAGQAANSWRNNVTSSTLNTAGAAQQAAAGTGMAQLGVQSARDAANQAQLSQMMDIVKMSAAIGLAPFTGGQSLMLMGGGPGGGMGAVGPTAKAFGQWGGGSPTTPAPSLTTMGLSSPLDPGTGPMDGSMFPVSGGMGDLMEGAA